MISSSTSEPGTSPSSRARALVAARPGFVAKQAPVLKRALRSALRASGFEISRSHARVDTVTALHWLIRDLNVSVVLDVGANEGEFGEDLRSRGFNGRLVSFEPRRAAFARLNERAARDLDWTVHQMALGDRRTEVTINVAANSVSSSILEMDPAHIEAAPQAEYVATERVNQARLDDLSDEVTARHDIVALKLDVQGYERTVLRGAAEMLARVAVLHIELSLAPVYTGAPDWRALMDGLIAQGFQLYALEPVFCNPTTGQTLQVDAVFRRG